MLSEQYFPLTFYFLLTLTDELVMNGRYAELFLASTVECFLAASETVTCTVAVLAMLFMPVHIASFVIY